MVTNKAEVRNIITVGASAGGLEAVTRLVKTFRSDMDAAVFIVIHLSTFSKAEAILKIIEKHTALKCLVPQDQQQIETRTIYLAPTDHHMVLEKGLIRITRGATENHYRPSIDVLFRSAATSYSGCTTGIILTGLLDDGTSGMNAIKRCGGRCIIQSPEEAAFPDMPNSVQKNIQVDYSVPITDIGAILSDLYSRSSCQQYQIPADIQLEADIARRVTSNMEDIAKLGEFTPLTCPDCGGVLVKIESESLPRYRCYTGHTFTEKFLEWEQLKRIEESLWVSIRMMEERKNLLLNMNSTAFLSNNNDNIRTDERIQGMQLHIDTLRATLLTINNPDEPGSSIGK
jgi:two-component system chemotaxis response regulator CheB